MGLYILMRLSSNPLIKFINHGSSLQLPKRHKGAPFLSVTFRKALRKPTKYIAVPLYNSQLAPACQDHVIKGGLIVKREFVKKLLVQMIGAAAAVCCPVYGCYPIVLAFFTAVYREKSVRFLVMPVMYAGLYLSGGMPALIKYGVCMTAAAVIMELFIRRKTGLPGIVYGLITAGTVIFVEGFGGAMTDMPVRHIVLGVFEGLTVLGAGGIFYQALQTLTGKRHYISESSEMVSVGVFAAMLVYALEGVTVGGIPFAETAVYLLILVYAYRCGAGMGGVIGTACGAVMLLISGDTAYFGTFCLLGVVVGFFNRLGKLASTLAYFACLWILAWVYVPFIAEASRLQGLLAAALIFLLLPSGCGGYVEQRYGAAGEDRLRNGSRRVGEAAAVFRRLAGSIRRVNRESDTVFAAELQLNEAAGIMEKISHSMVSDYEESEKEDEETLRAVFARKGYFTRRVSVRKGSRNETCVHMTLRTGNGRVETVKEAAAAVSSALGKRFKPAEGCRTIINGDFAGYDFIEEPTFMMLYGTAAETKSGEDISGDNFTFTELGTGEMLLGIVDGMGSGTAAGEDSELVIELLEELMRAGVEEEAALTLVNSVLLTREGEQSLTAIDMAVGDLYTGRFNFVKLGAAATFIKRNRWVEVLQSTNYPVGILKKVDYENTVKKLYDGDYVIMVSDGVLDAVSGSDKEGLLSEWISEYDKKNPKEFARYILDRAAGMNGGSAKDDMTVLVAGIWAKNS